MVVTDPGLIAAGLVAQVIAALEEQTVVFGDVQSNPSEADVQAGLDRYRDAKLRWADRIGGGSPIDAAKAIRLLVTHPGRLADYDVTRGGQDKIGASLPPLVAIPTTAGTGARPAAAP